MAANRTKTAPAAPRVPAPRKASAAATPPAQAASPAAPHKSPKTPKPAKAGKRSKPVRDSFTMPPADFAQIAALKARMLAAGRETKKSELLRAGLHALVAMSDKALLASLKALPPVKVGRPKASA